MPKSKVRNVVSVEVDELHPQLPQPNWREGRIESKAERAKLPVGTWWELLTFAILSIGFASLWIGKGNFGSRTEVPYAMGLLLLGVAVAAITGKFYATESALRKTMGLAALMAGGIALGISLALNTNPQWSWLVSLGFALAFFGWGIRRLAEESWIRALSLGLVFFIPFGFLKNSIVPSGIQNRWEEKIDQLAFWYGGVWADFNKVPFTPVSDEAALSDGESQKPKEGGGKKSNAQAPSIDIVQKIAGLRFTNGIVRFSGAFDNFAGILIAIALSVAVSVAVRHSLLVSGISICIAIMWWLVFRGGAFLSLASEETIGGPLVEQAMSIWWLLLMVVFIVASSLSFGAIFGPIPFDEKQYELSPLTIFYNAVVSFPQLGPSSIGMRSHSAPDSKDASSEAEQSE
jgi:hypothetical protein